MFIFDVYMFFDIYRRQVLRPISEEVMTNPAPPNVILRRKSTGSFDASKGRPNKQTIRPAEKNNASL